jgi:hypothetical protein
MLERECVVQGKMGKVLAAYLVEHLPFENNPYIIIDTVRLVLQPGLIDEDVRQKLWSRGEIDNAYHVGFLERMPDDLPLEVEPRAGWQDFREAADHPFARQLERVLSSRGQAFLQTADALLRYPADKDVANALLNALAAYFLPVSQPDLGETIEEIVANADALCSDPSSFAGGFLKIFPQYGKETRAMLILSCMDSDIAAPILAHSTASGTLMRQKLEPVSTPILQQIAVLRGIEFSSAAPRRRQR